jgi:hypothetical protein
MATVVIMLWTLVTSFLILKAIDLTIGLRVSLEHELYVLQQIDRLHMFLICLNFSLDFNASAALTFKRMSSAYALTFGGKGNEKVRNQVCPDLILFSSI